jgi:hypothetical protein
MNSFVSVLLKFSTLIKYWNSLFISFSQSSDAKSVRGKKFKIITSKINMTYIGKNYTFKFKFFLLFNLSFDKIIMRMLGGESNGKY